MSVKLKVFPNDGENITPIEVGFKEVHRSDTGGWFAIHVDEDGVRLCILTPEEDGNVDCTGVTLWFGNDKQAIVNARAAAKMLCHADAAIGDGIYQTTLDEEG